MNLSVKIGKLTLKNPVTVASGTFGHSQEYYNLQEVKNLGALIPKTITLLAREGNLLPRIVETPSGMLNAIGIENQGLETFIDEKLPALREIGIPLIISILGYADKEFVEMTKRLNEASGVSALELNLSCPNLGHKTLVSQDPKATYRLVKTVKKVAKIPIVAKLSPNVTDLAAIAVAAQEAGADGLSLVNTFRGMAINIKTRKPALGNVTGGLSGPAIRPLAVCCVYQVAQKVKIPIIGIGGIMDAKDAIEFFVAGASVVAVGTANFLNPRAPLEILDGIKAYMREHKIQDIKKLIGSVQVTHG